MVFLYNYAIGIRMRRTLLDDVEAMYYDWFVVDVVSWY